MKARSPLEVVEMIDRAFHEADLDALVGLYDDNAVQVDYVGVAGGGEFRGQAAIRGLYASFLEPGKFTVTQLRTEVVETDGIALLTSRWRVEIAGGEPTIHIATVVLRRQADGSWRNLIDTGPAVLDG